MSRNIQQLSARKGLEDNLFERLAAAGAERGAPDAASVEGLAREFLVGKAALHGSASFYDFLKPENAGKKAYVCDGSSCRCAGTQDAVLSALRGHFDDAQIGAVTCLGRCHENSAFQLDGRNYSGTAIQRLEEIIGNPDADGADRYRVDSLLERPVLTAAFGTVEDYYRPLIAALREPPERLLQQVKASKLRGRGGAGFPAALKWESCRDAAGARKYIVCNADEGDPGSYSDRYLLERQPHSVLFGMMAAGFAVGSGQGVLYIRGEYPEAIAGVERAISELTREGLLGPDIRNSGFSFQFKIIRGAGAYVCGEQTSLLHSIEGQRPLVAIRPPYSTTDGLYGQPTVVNNVETFACLRAILEMGGERFAALGTEASTGTKLVSLDGSFNTPGVYEVPMGTPLGVVVDRLGGGFVAEMKALHIGGPLGGLVPLDHIGQLTVDFESFAQHGFVLGHASIIGIPAAMPMIEYLEHLFGFTAEQSCGKCFPCRLGSVRGREMLRAAIDRTRKIDRQLLSDLLETLEIGSLCALGGGLPLPVRNALTHFGTELEPYFEE